MGSRGYRRQWRRARAQVRAARSAYFAEELPKLLAPMFERVADAVIDALDKNFAGLEGLYKPTEWPYPFDCPRYVGTLGGIARVHHQLHDAGFDIIPNGVDRVLFRSNG